MTVSGSENYTVDYNYNDSEGYKALLQTETKTYESEDNQNTGTVSETTVYTYDKNGNQLSKTTSSKTENFSYDGLNQLIGYTDGTTSASYAYNIEGLRVRKTVNGQSVKHIWDSNKQIAVEYNPDEDVYTADVYVRGTNLLANFSYSHGAKSDYHYYSQNAHGDVVNISDSSSAIIKSYSYDAFGVEKNIDESDTNCFRYCGEYYDKETGTVYLRARYYDPGIGRFISRDSFAGDNQNPLSLNLYTYCYNNPIVATDSSGHIVDTIFDVGCLVLDVVSFAIEPTPMGAVDIITDIVGIAVPGVPSAGLKIGVHAASKAYKTADKLYDASKLIDDATTITKTGDVILGVGNTSDKLFDAFRYGSRNRKKNRVLKGQAHHLSQDAAFGKVIPRKEGLSIRLSGNVRTEIGSPHYNAHEALERFWDDYREGGKFFGTKPTVGQYNAASYKALVSAGISNKQSAVYIRQAYEQQKKYNLFNSSKVPNIPAKMHLKKG